MLVFVGIFLMVVGIGGLIVLLPNWIEDKNVDPSNGMWVIALVFLFLVGCLSMVEHQKAVKAVNEMEKDIDKYVKVSEEKRDDIVVEGVGRDTYRVEWYDVDEKGIRHERTLMMDKDDVNIHDESVYVMETREWNEEGKRVLDQLMWFKGYYVNENKWLGNVLKIPENGRNE